MYQWLVTQGGGTAIFRWQAGTAGRRTGKQRRSSSGTYGGNPIRLAAIGGVGLMILLWLMVFKPF